MAIPASYTDDTLAGYMLAIVGEIAGPDLLDWSEWSFSEAVTNTLLAYGADDIADISGAENIRRLRMLATREAWRAVVFATAHEHDFGASLPGATNTRRSQIHRQARDMLALAEEQLVTMFPEAAAAWTVSVNKVGYGDKYVLDIDEREWRSRLG